MNTSPAIYILGDTVTHNDPRISKVARSLHEAGYRVTTVGIDVENQPLTNFPWNHIAVKPLAAYENVEGVVEVGGFSKLMSGILLGAAKIIKPINGKSADLLSKAARRSLRGQGLWERLHYYWNLRWGLRISPKSYAPVYWQSNTLYAQFVEAIQKQAGPCDLWIANDWDMLPIARKLQQEFGGKIWYDSHEFATDEFSEQAAFIKWKQPLVRAVERDLIKTCDVVSTVSPGLCVALQTLYGLSKTPLCIRNIPPFIKIPYRECGQTLKILYQGVVAPGRGLEALIASTAYWNDGKSLTIRGPENTPNYKAALQALIDDVSPVSSQGVPIDLAPSVPFSDLITAASKFDVGVMALPQNSVHQRFALPNKIFEYMMGGLAVLISDSANMREVIEAYDCGDVFKDMEPESIAKTINAMTSQRINALKTASLDAVTSLNWEAEFEKMRRSIETLTG